MTDPRPNSSAEPDETDAAGTPEAAAGEVSVEDLADLAGGKFVASPAVWYGDEEMKDLVDSIQNG